MKHLLCILSLWGLSQSTVGPVTISYNRDALVLTEDTTAYGVFTQVDLDVPNRNTVHLHREGEPALPGLSIVFCIPLNQSIDTCFYTALGSYQDSLTSPVYPGQPPRYYDFSPPPAFVPPDSTIYGSTVPYPSDSVSSPHNQFYAGWKLSMITVYPVHYSPAEGFLTVDTSFTLTPSLVSSSDTCLTVEERTWLQDSVYCEMLRTLVENPEDLPLYGQMGGTARPVYPLRGSELHVIIHPAALSCDALDELDDWYDSKGIPTRCYSVEFIAAQFPGNDTPTKIRNFIKEAYRYLGTLFVTLLGSTSDLPCIVWNPDDAGIATDLYYGALEGEWDVNGNGEYGEGDEWSLITYTPDVFVGRLPIPSTYRLNQFVDKLLAYEGGPPEGYHTTPFLSLAGYDDEEHGTGWMGDEILAHLPPGIDQENDIVRMYDSFYDGDYFSYTIDRDLVLNGMNSLNEGYFAIHHGGHGGSTLISVAADHTTSAEDRVWHNDLMGLTNYPNYGIFYSFACYTLPLDVTYNNFGWQWMIPDFESVELENPGGGIAYIGTTGRSWGNPDYGHVLLDRLFWTSLSEPLDTWVGQALAEAKLRHAALYPPSESKFWAWILVSVNGFFCSPTPIWFRQPEAMMEQHPAHTTPGDLEVVVRGPGGHPIKGGLRPCVCLWNSNEDVYDIEFATPYGYAMLDVAEPTAYPCTVQVTVTRTAFDSYQQLDQYELLESQTIVDPCGDANGDHDVTMGDGFLILNYFGSGPEPAFCRAANVNGDDDLTPGDGFHLLNYFGSGPELDCRPCELAVILRNRIRSEE